MNLQETLHKFEIYLIKNNCSQNTIDGYIRTIRQTMHDFNLNNFTQDELDEIAVSLISKYQIGGNRLRYAALNLFCREILKRDDLYLKIPKSQDKNKDILTNEQVEKILDVAKTKRKSVFAVLQTIYDCALRRSEACNLNISDVNFETMELSLRDTKTGDKIVSITSRVAESIKDYCLYERKSKHEGEQALILNRFGRRIGEHFIRNNLKRCAVEAGIIKRVYPHMLRASCITHLLNKGINPLTVQQHARHRSFKTTMIYNRPTQQQMKKDIERVFVVKKDLTKKDRVKSVVDKYLRGEISNNEMSRLLDVIRPKELNHKSELTGYV
jgi:site-specific recombinase XerD